MAGREQETAMVRAENVALHEDMTGPVLGVAVLGLAVAGLAGQALDVMPDIRETSGGMRVVWTTLALLRGGAMLQAAVGLVAGFGLNRKAYGLLQVLLVAQVLLGVLGAASWLYLSLRGEVVWGLLSGLAGGVLSVGMLARLWSAERRGLAFGEEGAR